MTSIALRIGLFLMALSIIATLLIQSHRSEVDKAGSSRVASAFLQELSKGDLASAQLYSWGDVMHASVKPPAFSSFRGATLLEIVTVKPTTAENRSSDYRHMFKMMTVQMRIKTILQDDSGNPPGEYRLFVLTVQPMEVDNWAVAEIGAAP